VRFNIIPSKGGIKLRQSDANKLLNSVLKKTGASYNWKCASGFLFKEVEPLFFSLIVSIHVKEPHLSYSLWYKILEFDSLFWKIVKLEDNSKQPLSFRATGAWVAPSMQILDRIAPLDNWSIECLSSNLTVILIRCEELASALPKQIDGPETNLGLLEEYYERHREKFSDTGLNLWRERMMTSIIMADYDNAEAIARERIENHDTGGFSSGSQSFYQLALMYLETIRHR